MTELIGLIAGTCTTLAFFPQVLRVWRTKSVQDISLGMYIIISLGVSFWVAYGILLGAPAIILANALTLIFTLAILMMKVMWGK